jgi:hypothetical protein
VGGDFSSNGYIGESGTAWHLLAGFDATFAKVGTEGCVTLHAMADGGIGWPPVGATNPSPVNLAVGASYTFSYTARTEGAYTISVQAKVGESMTPYTADFQTNDMVGSTATGFSHTFTATTGDTSAGLSFYFYDLPNETVCFSNVSLVAN